MKLFCAVIGEKDALFPVDIDASLSVGDLKKEIKKEQEYKFPASKLRLYLAKRDDAWLNIAAAEALTLKELPTSFVEMSPLKWLNNDAYYGKSFAPNEKEIHVLVVVPTRTDSEDPEAHLPKRSWCTWLYIFTANRSFMDDRALVIALLMKLLDIELRCFVIVLIAMPKKLTLSVDEQSVANDAISVAFSFQATNIELVIEIINVDVNIGYHFYSHSQSSTYIANETTFDQDYLGASDSLLQDDHH